MGRTKSGAKRWSAPKTANGMAKHRLLKATILSKPRALANSVFAAHAPTKKRTIPATHMAVATRETAKKAARMIGCMGLRFGTELPDSITRFVLRNSLLQNGSWEQHEERGSLGM